MARTAKHEADVSERISSRLKLYGWGGLAAVVAGVFAVFFGYVRAVTDFQVALTARLDQEFSTPSLQGQISAAALRAAQEVVRHELAPQVEQARAQVEQARTRVQELEAATREALAPVLLLQQIARLQGQGSAGDRAALSLLRVMASDTRDSTSWALAGGAYSSVLNITRQMGFREDLPLETTLGGRALKDDEIPDEELVRLLYEGDQPIQRGKAATFLARRRHICAVPVLARLMTRDGEPSLIALHAEQMALRELSGVLGVAPLPETRWFDPFDTTEIVEWWATNGPFPTPCQTAIPPTVDWTDR